MPYKARLKSGEPRKRAKPGYRVTNARDYNASLKKRGQLSLYCPDGDLKALFINDTPAWFKTRDFCVTGTSLSSLRETQEWQ
ncbi:hypothetical protein EVC45_43910, partial [Paraburkholderia sp. UYCP14C]|uniref:hypothetical protein n=1 Tax=Paraburkholderia sp. UYCP14C TaxID=2511130 RepID=UPI0010D35032